MKAFSLEGKTILVTGASSGIGRACAVAAANAGAKVIISGRNIERLEACGKEMGDPNPVLLPGDLTDAQIRTSLVEKLPLLDGVVHSAGTNALRPCKFIDAFFLQESLASNFEVPFLLTTELLKRKKLNRGASFVFIASISASVAMPGNAAYSAAKAALLGGLRVLAVEVAGQGMRANAISPGQVATPMTERTASHISAEALAENLRQYPLGFGEPSDVANTTVFLLSNASRWMTGADLVLDGGYTLR